MQSDIELSVYLWLCVILGLFVFGVWIVYIYNTPQAKAARMRRRERRAEEARKRAEEEQKREEIRRQKEKEEAEQKARQLEAFRKYRFVVYIREKDGRKSAFESVLIKALLDIGAVVQPFGDGRGKLIADGQADSLQGDELAVVGTLYKKTKEYSIGGGHLEASYGTGYYDVMYCDYRLLAKANSTNTAKFITAGCCECGDEDYYHPQDIVRELISAVSKMKKELVASSS